MSQAFSTAAWLYWLVVSTLFLQSRRVKFVLFEFACWRFSELLVWCTPRHTVNSSIRVAKTSLRR